MVELNGVQIKREYYDTPGTLLMKYASKRGGISIQDFFRLPKAPDSKSEKFKVDEVWDDLPASPHDLKKQISDIEKRYSSLTKESLICLWCIKVSGYLEEAATLLSLPLEKEGELEKKFDEFSPVLRSIVSGKFSSGKMTLMTVKKFITATIKKRESMLEDLSDMENIMKSLSKVSPHKTSGFIAEEITKKYGLILPDGEGIYQVFDKITPNENLPYFHLKLGERNIYKVLQTTTNLDSSGDVPEGDGLHFTVMDKGEKTSGFWSVGNDLTFTWIVGEGSQDEKSVFEMIMSTFGDLNYEIASKTQVSIKGTFSIPDVVIKMPVLGDLISLDDTFSFLLKLDESKKTILSKKKFTFYFTLSGQNPGDKDVITSLMFPAPDIKGVKVRVMRSSDSEQIDSYIQVFSRLVTLYSQEEDEIIKEYSALLSGAKKMFDAYVPKEKERIEDKKTGERLKKLQENLPEVFKDYSRKCQPKERHPILISEEDRGKYKKDETMNFPVGTDNWFACFEPGGTSKTKFPGLTKSFVPCCFETTQYSSGRSKDKKDTYLMQALEGAQQSAPERKEGLGYIIKTTKVLPPGRVGVLPRNLMFMADLAGYKIETTIDTYPLIRYGVEWSPSSLLYCLETATRKGFSTDSATKRKRIVDKVRQTLASLKDREYNVLKQEFYDRSVKRIKSILQDENKDIDPFYFLPLLSRHYKVNILAFQTDPNHPDGAILIPRHSEGTAYLFSDFDKNLPTVFIHRNFAPGMSSLYQCELLGVVENSNTVKTKFEGKDKIVDIAISQLFNTYNVSVVKSSGVYSYEPLSDSDPLLQGVSKQYIDDKGKTRLLVYENGITIFTSPLPPLDASVTTKTKSTPEAPVSSVKEWIKEVDLQIKFQDSDGKVVQGLWVESEKRNIYDWYIPVEVGDALEGVDLVPAYLNDPFRTDASSELTEARKTKKVAYMLMQYTLFEYSFDPSGFGENSFVVDKDHVYGVGEWDLSDRLERGNAVFYRDDKLVVPSEEIRKRLVNYVQVELMRDKNRVLGYKNRKFMDGYYVSLFDFTNRKNTLIFTTTESIQEWARRSVINNNSVRSFVDVNTRRPYLYFNPYFRDGEIVMIQNVSEGDITLAATVSQKWNSNHVNEGFEPLGPYFTGDRYNVFTEDKGLVSENWDEKLPSVIEYPNGEYGAVLLFE